MILGLTSTWIILSVILPGVIFYGVFSVLYSIFGIENSTFDKLNENQAFSVIIVGASGLLVQFFGMISEKFGFKLWDITHKVSTELKLSEAQNPKLPYSETKQFLTHWCWKKRYTMIRSMVEADSLDERYIVQFFMAHNISVGIGILFLSTLIYLLYKNIFFEYLSTFLLLGLAFALSICVSQMRFRLATDTLCDLYDSYKKNQTKGNKD